MYEILICILAGLLAGVGTGFAGLSAAVFIAPMLISFLGVESYSAVGIALASDILASAVSAFTYAKHGNVDMKRGFPMLISVLFATIVGSIIAYKFVSIPFGEAFMSVWLISGILFMGLRFLIRPGEDRMPHPRENGKIPEPVLALLCGLFVGFICGFQGTGGGLWMLFALNILLRFEYRKAVGTSVSIMTLTALIGAFGHFFIHEMPDLLMLSLCVVSTLIGAQGAALIANRISPKLLKRLTGALMVVAGIGMVLAKLF